VRRLLPEGPLRLPRAKTRAPGAPLLLQAKKGAIGGAGLKKSGGK
jgi:hypothetical protein